MAYEIGTSTSTFDLFDKLTDFMKTVSGWQLWSNIDGYGHRDFVYRSSGADGRKDVFIRQRIGQPEPFLSGAEQYDYGSGDTGYLNFFSYLYYPHEGDAYAGASEVGSFGPRLFLFNGDDTYRRLYYQDFLGQKKAGAEAIAYGTPAQNLDSPETLVDTHGIEKRRWTEMGIGNIGSSVVSKMTTDGKRFLYLASTNGVFQYSMARDGGVFTSTGSVVNTGTQISSTDFYFLTFFENRTTGKHYLFAMTDYSTDNVTLLEVNSNGLVGSTTVSGPSWPTSLGSGGKTIQKSKASCWDGKRYVYVLRGGTSTINNNYPAPDWGRFDTWTNTWLTNSIPENPEFRGFYTLLGSYDMKFMNKNITGYDRNRLYVYAGGYLYAMDLGDDGLPSSINPFWTIVDDPFVNISGDDGRLIPVRSNRIFAAGQFENGPQNKYDTFQSRPERFLYYSDFSPSDGQWRAADASYFPVRLESPEYLMVDGYACRVNSSGAKSYMFIGDEDRIIVATSSTGAEWSVAYMGAFESAYDSDPYAVVDGDVRAGRFRKIKVKHKSGDFIVGDKYFITGSNGPVTYQRYEPDGRTIPIGHSESIIVAALGDDFIIASIYNDYNDGAKISIDPQPVGVFFWELEKFQATNAVNRLDDDLNGSDSPSKQTYTIPIPESSINSVRVIAGNIKLTDCTISTGESEGDHIGRETRGRMKGVFAVGSSSISAGSSIVVDGGAYIVLNMPGYLNKHLAIGPIE